MNNNNGADDHAANFASFDAGADSSDFVVIDSESLDVNITWEFRDTRFVRRDMTDLSQTYDVNWTIDSFTNTGADLGNVTGSETLISLGVGTEFGFTNHLSTGGTGAQVVPTDFDGTIPEAELSYSGAATGELTGKYDGSNFSLTLGTTQSRDTNATTWNEAMDGNGNGDPGQNARAQLRAFIEADYTYQLTYSTYTFVPVPEPSVVAVLFTTLPLLFSRRRYPFLGTRR